MGAAGLTPTAKVAKLPAPSACCGTCVFFAEDFRNAPTGGCISPRSPHHHKTRAATAEACPRYILDDEAPPMLARQPAAANG
jgi:hypothetical protein